LCDRYFDSSFAYQGYARGLGLDKIIELNENISDSTFPDLTVYFDITTEQAFSRVDARGNKNRLDKESKDFREKVIEGYHKLIKRYPKRYRIIDAGKSPAEVFDQVKDLFDKEVFHNK